MKSIHTKLQDIAQEYFSNHDVEAQGGKIRQNEGTLY